MFSDRADAGRRLAARLDHLRGRSPVVLGLPRGGIPVAAEIAAVLGAPLDVIVVRKLGVPSQPELAMGAVGEDAVIVLNDIVVRRARVSDVQLQEIERRERAVVASRAASLRAGRPRVELRDRLVVIVDDGLATGATARAAIEVARAHGAARVVLAIPVAPPDTVAQMRHIADDVVCLESPDEFMAVGQWYRDFTQVSDESVAALLAEH
jgi:putative phosphoribosyl transferase